MYHIKEWTNGIGGGLSTLLAGDDEVDVGVSGADINFLRGLLSILMLEMFFIVSQKKVFVIM